ncbi:MAG: PQQ-binding-like beta-propeller repeat protein [Clostridia bacterium]|nr:PQQ-binding-like beta-propeller repeat protein [Clostridia bacterium]
MEANEPETVLDAQLPEYGMDVMAMRQYDGTERLTVVGYDASGAEKWRYVTDGGEPTELSMSDAFVGGTPDDPRVLVFNAQEGLYSLNLYTGEVVWLLKDSEVNLGASISHAVGNDGSLYICGYYGPDPVCISHDGRVRWQSESGSDDIYWPYRITVEDRGIVTQYAMMDRGEHEGRVIYDRDDGHVVDIEYDRN